MLGEHPTPRTLHLLAALTALLSPSLAPAGTPDFIREVRPILATHCFNCHGPDPGSRKADLRLDTPEGARAALAADATSLPPLLARITAAHQADIMPPPETRRPLSPAQIETLTSWLAAGAPYADHWAWSKPAPPTLPPAPPGQAARHPIDHFVLQGLATSGLKPNPEADRHTLIRRLSLDLTGLPPSPEDVAAFVSDPATDAYEKLVDRLLNSPHTGEHLARHWLDLARFADSNGYQADQLRDLWAYRDWVIRAFESDMPFAEFTTAQLAGDLLPTPSIDHHIATGFHRTTPCNVEAGVHPEENRTTQVFDRVNTTATVWLGLTMECAQCHDHKYDPLSMVDYYQLYAYFNNTPLEVENSDGRNVQFEFTGPTIDLPLDPDQHARHAALSRRIADLQAARTARASTLATSHQDWLDDIASQLANPPDTTPVWHHLEIITTTGSGESFELLDDASVLVSGKAPERSSYHITARLPESLPALHSFRLEALTHPSLPGTGPGRGDPERTNFVLNELQLRTPDSKTPIPLTAIDASFAQDNWALAGATDGKLEGQGQGWAIAPQFKKDHWASFELAAPLDPDARTVEIALHQNFGQARTIGRFRLSASASALSVPQLPEDLAQALLTPAADRSGKQAAALAAHHQSTDPQIAQIDADLAAAQGQLAQIKPATTLAMVESTPRQTHILQRGDYLSPGDPVSPATPSILHPLPPDATPDRLGLARWINHPDNPLTHRVHVNRIWALLFGRGIVSTVEDFGTQGDLPSHPELLDWLALDFASSGGSTRALLRTIVTSATYRQSNTLSPQLLEADPDNVLLARAPRLRLDAERIRDSALVASGLLSPRRFGPPVMPHQPDGIWRHVGRNAPTWTEASDEDRFRRAIYVVWRRGAPYPSFVNFDAPDRASCTPARPSTNTPLQALTLLNDPAYVELALGFASSVLTAAPAPPTPVLIADAFSRALSRQPSPQEAAILEAHFDASLSRYRASPQDADALIRSASKHIDLPPDVPQPLLAAWWHVTHAILNLDEFINRP